MGLMYQDGLGVPQDYVQAYAWSNLAAAAGNWSAKGARDGLLKRRTRGQVAKAQALGRELAAKLRE